MLTLGQDHGVRKWTRPGPVEPSPILEGGELVRTEDPTRIAVDYTHAFSYDSGPETPRSPEYLALCRENSQKPSGSQTFTRCSKEQEQEVIRLLPQEYLDRSRPTCLPYALDRLDDDIWVTVSQYSDEGFMGLVQLES